MMRRLVVMLIIALAFTASAQYNDLGVEKEVDEFEGTTLCQQTVIHTRHPDFLALSLGEDPSFGLAVGIARVDIDIGDTIFNMYGAMNGDEVLFRFSNGDVLRFDVVATQADPGDDFSYTEVTVISPTVELLKRLVSTSEDVRFRLSPASGTNFDDTLPAEFLNEFSEFLEECL